MVTSQSIHTWHNHRTEEAAAILLPTLHDQTKHHYTQFTNNLDYVLPWHHSLFTQRSLQEWLKLTDDQLSCWLWSIEEACSILSTQESHLWSTSALFFSMFRLSPSTRSSSGSTDSFYSITTNRTALTASLTDPISDDCSLSLTTNTSCSTNSYLAFLPDDNISIDLMTIFPPATPSTQEASPLSDL